MKKSLLRSPLVLVAALILAGTFLWAESRFERPVTSARAGDTAVSGETAGWDWLDDVDVALNEDDDGYLPRPVRIVARVLELSDHQIDGLLVDIETVAGLNEERRANNQEIREELNSGDPDTDVIGNLVIDNHEIAVLIAEIRLGFVGGLNEEQKKRLDTVRMAWRLQPVLPAFRALGLLPHHRGAPDHGEAE